ncbi:MAG: hypothetical protein HOP03_05610 [Lysobacter sp.]|nr:hypothetical protein [Lysobacter sp.]
MALLEDRTTAFIVRIWCERGDTASLAPEWRGSVEHVQTGQRAFFRHLDAVIDFMKPHLEGIGIDAQQRFWERISTVMDDGEQDIVHDPTRAPKEFRIDFGAESPASPSALPSAAAAAASASAAASLDARKSR